MAFKCNPYYGTAKPILFNGEMVRSILSGQKTQTRRPVKLDDFPATHVKHIDENQHFQLMPPDTFVFSYFEKKTPVEVFYPVKPQYDKGDILYVREAWGLSSPTYDNVKPSDIRLDALPGVAFKATDKVTGVKWRPSIHMPKWAARIWLEVTNVRCERLQQITEEEAIREGFDTRRKFLNTWDELYTEHSENSFVWIYEFKHVDRSELPEN